MADKLKHHCPTCGAFPVDVGAALEAGPSPESTLRFHTFPCAACGEEMGQVLRGVYTFTVPHPLRLTDAEFVRKRDDVLAGMRPPPGGPWEIVAKDGAVWVESARGRVECGSLLDAERVADAMKALDRGEVLRSPSLPPQEEPK